MMAAGYVAAKFFMFLFIYLFITLTSYLMIVAWSVFMIFDIGLVLTSLDGLSLMRNSTLWSTKAVAASSASCSSLRLPSSHHWP
jgi:hypothetical protein